MILRADPADLTETARALGDAVAVAREVDGARRELAVDVARAGSEPVRRSAESFLDAWAAGLRLVGDRAEALAGSLDTAAASYAEAEERLRGEAASGSPGAGGDVA